MPERTFTRLSPRAAREWLTRHPDALLLDAREARHHALAHLAGALRLDGRNHEALVAQGPRSRPVFVYCYHGNASQTWAGLFADFGFVHVADLVGGWAALDPEGRLHGPQDPMQLLPRPRPSAALAEWLAQTGFDAADPSVPGPHGNTPLMHAAWRARRDLVDELLGLGVPLAACNDDGNNALWLACVSGDCGLVRQLVAAGVPLDHANLTGATVLMYAASAGKDEVLAQLLALGADPGRRSQDGFSALDMATTLAGLRLLRAASDALPA